MRSGPVRQRPPIRIFKDINSKNEFVPLIYYQGMDSPSTICASSWSIYGYMTQQSTASYMCSVYGAPADEDDMTYDWSQGVYEWENWRADYYTGNNSLYQASWAMGGGDGGIGSVQVVWSDPNYLENDWMITSSMDQLCFDQTNVVAVKCGASDFCLESGESCATDLDCCQSPGDPMYCQPSWGTCVHTV